MEVEEDSRAARNKRRAEYCIGCHYLHIGENVDHNHCDIKYDDARVNGYSIYVDGSMRRCPHKKEGT